MKEVIACLYADRNNPTKCKILGKNGSTTAIVWKIRIRRGTDGSK